MTTRPQRPGEVDGVDYFFRSREEFEDLIVKVKCWNTLNMSVIIMVHL